MCRSRDPVSKRVRVNAVENNLNNDTSSGTFTVFGAESERALKSLSRVVSINGRDIEGLIDTGSELNVISRSVVPHVNLLPTEVKISAFGNFPLPVIGKTNLNVTYREKCVNATFYVIDCDVPRPLFSYPLTLSLGMIQELLPADTSNCNNLSSNACFAITNYSDVFEGMGSLTS